MKGKLVAIVPAHKWESIKDEYKEQKYKYYINRWNGSIYVYLYEKSLY